MESDGVPGGPNRGRSHPLKQTLTSPFMSPLMSPLSHFSIRTPRWMM
ncbi:conserved integral membrane domain protein [Mycobacterium ulcerans str. Harvey]|uniref:Conserved integral membrane domain protein n=1 Tax=Mycobacterium ulcerans str. Harvey TaxID=1299332 RepID=A0ABN0QMU4_MYCUL|nr:conserved integral membrane domain protein [Mycobacterium ulcerans str. Harvey]